MTSRLSVRYLAAMTKVRSIPFKKQHIIALVAVIVAGIIVGQMVGLWAGLAAAAVMLGANERRLRA